jgi:hypothetical protein
MSDKPRDPTLERVNRLTQAVADLTESHAAQGASIISIPENVPRPSGDRSRALRTNIRLDEIEDIQRQS